jgi:hypothetical protein
MVDMSVRVFLNSYPNAEGEKVVANLLRVYMASDRTHFLVDNPDQADVVLIGGIGNEMSQDEYIAKSIVHPLIERYTDKAFTVSYRDTPIVFNRGVYESALNTLWTAGRCIAGSYELSGHVNSAVSRNEAAKDLLFSFIGRGSHPCRTRIFNQIFVRRDILLEDSSLFNYWDSEQTVRSIREQRFASVLSRSKFCLCPRGAGAGSIRLFEAMRAGIAPVIIADDWIRPPGLPWDQFSITIRETEIDQLESRIAAREADHARMGDLARACWQKHFAPASYFDYIVSRCVTMQKTQRIPESAYWALRHGAVASRKVQHGVQAISRRLAALRPSGPST